MIYLSTVSPTVNFIDSGELITALHEPGIVHPPGYPLYTLMGYVVSRVLPGEVAWRVNALSAFWGAVGVGTMYALLLHTVAYTRWRNRPGSAVPPAARRTSRRGQPQKVTPQNEEPHFRVDMTTLLSALIAACLLGAASTFWNRSIQAKMYTLHYFFMLLILLLAVAYRWAYERRAEREAGRLLVILALTFGLSLTNHLMTSLLVPGVLVLLSAGGDWRLRLRVALSRWKLALPALLLPLLLYAYLPIRSSQDPVMNWGTPSNFPDFWRHVRGWQYTAYFLTDVELSIMRLWGFATSQWVWLTWIVLLLAVGAGALLARANSPIFYATLLTALLTMGFGVAYGISEIEPYQVPLYAMLLIWLGNAPPLLDRLPTSGTGPGGRQTNGTEPRPLYGAIAAGVLGLIALLSVFLQYPRQNHSNDRLAELSVVNAFRYMEPNSIVLTDHWDFFFSPGYYLQQVRSMRPDVTVIDKSLVKYPWYLGQLEQLYPWLVANSRDLVEAFRVEQRKFVNGEPYDPNRINTLYLDLLTSFVERNADEHPVYIYFRACPANMPQELCENNQIAPSFRRAPSGLALRLWRELPAGTLPPDPVFDLSGYTTNRTPLDEFAIANAGLYLDAYRNAARQYSLARREDKSQEMFMRAQELELALLGR
jgi:hypothetical protein